MKNVITILLFLVLTFIINAQDEQCGLISYSSNMAQDYGIPSNFEGGSVVVKIYFLAYSDNDGNGGVDAARIQQVFETLSTFYAGTGISFYYSPCETEFVRSNVLHNSTDICDFVNPNRHTDGMDIHVKGDLTSFVGVASNIPGDEYLVGGSRSGGIPTALSSTIAHEMGHCLGLFHTHHGTCNETGSDCFGHTIIGGNASTGDFVTDTPTDPSGSATNSCVYNNDPFCAAGNFNPNTNNIMSYYPHTCRTNLTAGQIARIMMTILPTVIYSGSSSSSCSCENLIVTTNTEINTNLSYKKIEVKNNSILTIKSSIVLEENIVVDQGSKLIIDGGVLTSCPNSTWQGIQAWGNPFTGQLDAVELKNGAIIENAQIGINTSNIVAGGIFGAYFNLSGAKVISNNSTIRNCGIGVNFGPYGYSGPWLSWGDQSSFENTSFVNCGSGVVLQGNLGVEFKNSSFTGARNIGIEVINSQIDVTGCDFSGSIGIYFSATWPSLIGSNISNNSFFSIDGINMETQGNATHHQITGNFFGCDDGVIIYGQAAFNVQSNDFVDGFVGVSSWFTGDDYNLVSDNGFLGNLLGTSAYFDNNIEYLGNCFDYSINGDLELFDGASIFSSQGDESTEAGNCFSFGVPRILTGAGSVPFDYYVKSGTLPESCKKPGSGTFFEKEANAEYAQGCGSGAWNSLPPKYRNCIIPNNLKDKKLMEDALKAEIIRIEKDPNISPALKKWLIARYLRCLKKLKGEIGLQIIKEETDGKEKAIAYFSEQPLFSHKIMAYAIMMESNELTRATTYLNGLTLENSAQSDFVFANNLYLSYLKNRDEFVLPNTTKETLKAKAMATNELSGYARSIYYALTGERLRIPLSHTIQTEPRTSNFINFSAGTIASYPNPVTGDEHIVEINTKVYDQKYVISVRDIMGRVLKTVNGGQGDNILDMTDISNGIYIVEVMAGNERVFTTKVVRL